MKDWYTCDSCYWAGPEANLLVAPHPFLAGETIVGCPNCKDIERMFRCCDEPGCRRQMSCGTPTPTGYRGTCHEHRPPPAAKLP